MRNVFSMTASLSGEAFYEMLDSLKEEYMKPRTVYRIRLTILEDDGGSAGGRRLT